MDSIWQDPCPVGLPEILTGAHSAHSRLQSGVGRLPSRLALAKHWVFPGSRGTTVAPYLGVQGT